MLDINTVTKHRIVPRVCSGAEPATLEIELLIKIRRTMSNRRAAKHIPGSAYEAGMIATPRKPQEDYIACRL